MIEIKELYGKVLLIGITFVTEKDDLIDQYQTYGRVEEIHSDYIRLRQKSGELFTLPAAFESLEEAPPGEYSLKSTGETVINPDYTTTWTVTCKTKDNIESYKLNDLWFCPKNTSTYLDEFGNGTGKFSILYINPGTRL